VRGYDELFRYGGDEFVLLLPDTGPADAVRLAAQLTEEVKSRELPGDPPLHVSVSLGVATCPEDGTDAAALLASADKRNYLAKRRGRGVSVADDVETDAVAGGSSRLWDRDAEIVAAQNFLGRLQSVGRGTLRVAGAAGSGHTRFLTEVAKIASLRGFRVVQLLPAPAPLPEPPAAGDVLLVADLDAAMRVGAALDHLAGRRVLGLIQAMTGDPPEDAALPLLSTVELSPWPPSTVKIWLRTVLQGEPSRTLVSWITGNSAGLPARAVYELDRLRERDGLVPTESGGWTVAPALLGRPKRRTRLPVPLTGLVGREQERARVTQLLAGARLVTLAGPGGIGKTRLSLSVAASVVDDFEDGAVFVPLADASGTELVVAAVAQALQVHEVPGQPLLDAVTEHLADASMLLVLDNFEQVVDRAATTVAHLLAAAPGLKVLVTSRERLALYGEQVYQVPPLPLPDLDALPRDEAGVARALVDSPALALFNQRAGAADADFTLTPDTLGPVAALCRLLDGLPLGIELAAARTDRWRPDELLIHLTHHLDELGDGPRDLPQRQQTLRGAIDWSVVLLAEADRDLFTRLAVFTGGCTVDAARAVAGTGAGGRLAARLASLADKNLLVAESDPDDGVRYRMLETIRAYALSRLDDGGHADAARTAHTGYYVGFAERCAVGLTGPEQAEWAGRVEREYQNLRTAFGWAVAQGEPQTPARVCLGLWRYWLNGNHIGEGREWLDTVLSGPDGLSDAVRTQVLYAAATLAGVQADHERAYRLAGQGLRTAEAAGDRPGAAKARNALGIAAIGGGDYHLATDHFRQSLAIWREVDDGQGTAAALGNLTKVSLRLGNVGAASQYAEQCLRLERAAGNTRGILLGLECLGQILLAQGDVSGAREALEESLTLSQSVGDVFGEAMALHQLGIAAEALGDTETALKLLTAALARRHEVGDREDLATSLDSVAHLVVQTDATLAARLLGAADGLRERHRLPAPPDAETRRADTLEAVLKDLDERAFAVARTAGRGAPLDLIVDEVLDLVE
jgi:predicted ATPase